MPILPIHRRRFLLGAARSPFRPGLRAGGRGPPKT